MGFIKSFIERHMPETREALRIDAQEVVSREFESGILGVLMNEGLSRAEAQLQLEDGGWLNVTGSRTQIGEQTTLGRRATINKARVYSLLDPHAIAALRTWNNYTLGTGMTFKAEDTAVQEKLDKFWKHRKNRGITSAMGQHKSNRRLLADGEVFFALFQDDEAGALIRRVDTTEITDIITDPNDSEVHLLYRREFLNGTTSTPVVWYYRDWAFQDEDLSGLKDPVTKQPIDQTKIQYEVVIYHLPFNPMFKRGNSLLTGSLPWLASLRQFMEDRSAITSGLAKFIRKLTIKGGKAQMDKAVSAVQAAVSIGNPRYAEGGAARNELVRQSARTFMGNDNVSIDDMPRTTGASDARQDFKNLRLMNCASMGMTEPYFGDAESGNLATATAMELPMLKQFQTHQQLWIEAWVDMFSIVMNFEEPTPVTVDCDMPPIILDNVLQWAQAVSAAIGVMPELKQPEVMREALTQLGINNVDEVMKAVEALAQKNAEFADKQKQQMLNNPQPTDPNAKPANAAKLAEAIVSFFEAHAAE